MNKEEILEALEDQRENFLDVIDGLSEQATLEQGVVGDWSVKDLIAHLSLWEAELVKMLWQVQQSQRPTSAHFGQIPVDELNETWHKEFLNRPLDRILADFHAVRRQTARRVDAFSTKDLNDPARFPWLKGRPLWEWVASDSFEHEAEHAAQIREWRARKNI